MKFILKTIKNIINCVMEGLFPSKCLGCQIKDEILCDNCLSKIERTERQINDQIIAIFQYHNPLIKKILWDLKYFHRPYLGKRLGEILYNELLEDISDLKMYTDGAPIWIIPVPITKHKSKLRGYNQAKKIARGLSECGENNLFQLKSNIITKKIETLPQAKISNRVSRLKNIKNSFELKKSDSVKGQTIVIVDDITTTGATINEIIKLLERAGAKKIIGVTVAH